jgi:hypothetical protein
MNLHHRDPERGLQECDGIRMLVEPGGAGVELHAGTAMPGPDELGIRVFMVHADQAARRATRDLREIRHRIGVRTKLAVLR